MSYLRQASTRCDVSEWTLATVARACLGRVQTLNIRTTRQSPQRSAPRTASPVSDALSPKPVAFEAGEITSLKIGTRVVPLQAGPDNDFFKLAPPASDYTVRELTT